MPVLERIIKIDAERFVVGRKGPHVDSEDNRLIFGVGEEVGLRMLLIDKDGVKDAYLVISSKGKEAVFIPLSINVIHVGHYSQTPNPQEWLAAPGEIIAIMTGSENEWLIDPFCEMIECRTPENITEKNIK